MEFVSCELLEQEIESSSNNLIMKVRLECECLHEKKICQLDAINSIKNKIKKSKKKSKIKDYDSRLSDFQQNLKTTMILEFDQSLAYRIKFLNVNQRGETNL